MVATPPVWLHPVSPAAGCGGCGADRGGPPCAAPLSAEACAQPLLTGPQDELARVMHALNDAVVEPGAGRGIVDLQWVRALRIEAGEAELTLSFATNCGPSQALSESAFQTLRRLLPDTDVYVRHRAPEPL